MTACPQCGNEIRPENGRCPICASIDEKDPLTPARGAGKPAANSSLDESEATEVRPLVAPLAKKRVDVRGRSLKPGQSFGQRYKIRTLLGTGGMGAVYQAWDEELRVDVALKIILPRIVEDDTVEKRREERFKRELLLARQVTHKNVVRIHDIGEVEGTKYITMPYLEGSDLSTLLKRADKLPIRRSLRIVRQVAAGLSAAHEVGVVHRDLKPANIMVDDEEHTWIMDFGLARLESRPAPDITEDEETRLRESGRISDIAQGHTELGVVVGTLAYMAPEQARGDPVDHRVDIYAFGLILRHMILGSRWAGHAPGVTIEKLKKMDEDPTSLRAVNPNVPSAIDRLVTRCLQPDPAARYQNLSEIMADLDKLDDKGHRLPFYRKVSPASMAAAFLFITMLIIGTWWLAKPPTELVQPDPLSVLVADFANKTDDPVFDGSVEQALGIALEDASFITSYSRTNAKGLAERLEPGRALDEDMARLVSRREGIKVVLAGSVESRNSGYEISVHAADPAIDANSGDTLASASTFVSSKADVLGAIGELASELRGELGDATPESVRLAAAETFTAGSLEAMSAYSRGQDLNYRGETEKAIEAFQEAVRLDPELGRAYAGMGTIYRDLRQYPEAEANYQQALKNLGRMTEREKYRTLGGYYISVARNYEKAIENYETLVELYPADNTGHANLALAYLFVRNIPQAVSEGRKAIEIYPNNVLQRTNYAAYCMYAGDFETAIEESNTVLEAAPDYDFAMLTLGLSSIGMGDINTAREAYSRMSNVGEFGASVALIGKADLEMYRGRYHEAVELLQEGISLDQEHDFSGNLALKYVALAEAYQALGQGALASEVARKAAELSQQESVLYPAARVLLQVGEKQMAQEIAEKLENQILSQSRAYAAFIVGELARHQNKLPDAIEAYRSGLERHDAWIGRYLLGRAYMEAGHHPEALDEFELCLKRKGEATDAFIADTPTIRYLPIVYYWLARVQETLGVSGGARENYQTYIRLLSEADPPDRFVTEAVERLSKLES
jgi:serine/threonine protein kinase/tetratricopeptide (TPR) repeat protein